MKNLEEIKKQIAELVLKVDELEKTENDGMYHFNEDELISFVLKLNDSFIDQMNRGISRVCFDDDCVNLDLYGREIQIEIDSDEIRRNLESELEFDLDKESIKDTIADIYKTIKG